QAAEHVLVETLPISHFGHEDSFLMWRVTGRLLA
ncbi:MAG: hypothetical protein K0S98_2919, partial [Propionibacteriaceae bacterium]|nr:hypothetical protein [Propionibacteriaceae bacterium]